MILWAVVVVVALIIQLAMLALNWKWPEGISKMITSTAFMAVAVAGGAFDSTYGIIVLVALGFSWLGDLFLFFTNETLFLLGLIVFFLSHVGYCAAFLLHGVAPMGIGIAAAAMIIPFIVIFFWLRPHLDDMAIPVYAYMIVISIMVALSFGAVAQNPAHWLMPVAAVLFYISDIFVARDRFVKPGKDNRYMGLPLYFAGQTVFAWTVSLMV